MTESKTIPLDAKTQRFYQGVTTANKVIEAHAQTPFPDQESRVAFFWFYTGALAVSDHECKTSEEFSNFIMGASTRAPSMKGGERAQGTCACHPDIHAFTDDCVGWRDA